MISAPAVVVTELLSRVIGDELLVAFSALGHGQTYLSILHPTMLPQKTVKVKLENGRPVTNFIDPRPNT
jgi:hypothetical protein